MSSLRHPHHFQHEIQLDSVRCLLGWTTPELVGRIRAGKVPLRDLAAGEFVLFNAYAMCGLVPPMSSFFFLLLEEFGLQLQHLTPHSVLLVAVFAHFMEMFVGSLPAPPSSGTFTPWSGQGGASARLAPTTSSSGKGRPTPTSALPPVLSGRTGVTAGSSPRLTPTSFRYHNLLCKIELKFYMYTKEYGE
jgi:hypothetical protein